MTMNRKRATWRVPLDVLSSALMLPDDVEIELVVQDPRDIRCRLCQLVLMGDGLPASTVTAGEPVAVSGRYVDQEGAVRLFFEIPEGQA